MNEKLHFLSCARPSPCWPHSGFPTEKFSHLDAGREDFIPTIMLGFGGGPAIPGALEIFLSGDEGWMDNLTNLFLLHIHH